LGEIVSLQDALEKTVLSYSKAKNTEEETFNIYRDVEIGKMVLQLAGYSLLAFVTLALFLIFMNINETVAGTTASANNSVACSNISSIYKPMVMAIVTGVLYWAFIKFMYIDVFEKNVLEMILKAQSIVNAFNNAVTENISSDTGVMNKLNSDNDSEFKKYISTLTDQTQVVQAIVHYNMYVYYKSSTNSFASSDIRKKLVGTLGDGKTEYSDWISVGCSKIIKNQFYDMDFIIHSSIDATSIETGLSTSMASINAAKSEMKSALETLVPKFGSYLMQRMIASIIIFSIALVTLFAMYNEELAVFIRFLKEFFARFQKKDSSP
jgi:hypothetical protein